MSRRTRTWAHFALILVVVLLSLSVVSAQEAKPEPVGLRPDAPPFALHGPYWVGTQDFVIDPDSDQPLEITVWYPALNPEGIEESIVYTDIHVKFIELPPGMIPVVMGHALQNAAFDMEASPYPLVIFSHGFGVSRYMNAYLTEHLASYGFAVIAPDHLETWDPEGTEIWQSSIERPLDVQRVITYADELTAVGGSMEGLIDTERIGVVGHSYGGYTALAAAGARYDLQSFNQRCEAARAAGDPNVWLCDPLIPHEADMAALAGLDPIPEGLWPSWGDPRVKAIVPMAGDSYLFDRAGLAEITVPVLAMGGTLDNSTPYEWGTYPTYQYASSQQKALVTFENANHMIFFSGCEDWPWLVDIGWFFACSDSVWEMARADDLVNHFTTAFLLDVLKGDKDAHAALAPEAVSFPGIEYQAEGF